MPIAVEFNHVSKYFVKSHRATSFRETVINLFSRQRGPRQAERLQVLDDVSFKLEVGQTIGFIGANGAGKSSLLKLIVGILQPTSGEIRVSGRIAALLELGAGFHPELTGRENIYLNGSIMGLSRNEVARKFDDIVAFSELEDFIDMPVKHYSSGMYVRLGFSVAVNTQPEILLVDEVLAVGDAAFQRKCMDRIYDIRRQGVTILMVSHGLDAITRLCNRLLWLKDGIIKADGDSRQVADQYLQWINQKDQERLEKQADKKNRGSLEKQVETEAPEPLEKQADAEDPAPSDESQPVEPRIPLRGGTGEIRVTSVDFLDVQGVAVQVLCTGDPLTIRLYYCATELVEHPVFGIGLYRDDDLHVTGPNTKISNMIIPVASGESYVDYVIDHLPLMAGRYELTVAVYDETLSHQFDGLHRAYSFSVQPRTVWDTLGVVHLPARWSLPEAVKDNE